MRRLVLATLGAALLGAPAGASGQSFIFGFGSERAPLASTQIELRLHGSVIVEFRGDPGTGCAAAGLCDVAGTIAYTPEGRGTAYMEHLRGGRTTFVAFVHGHEGQARLRARVNRTATDGTTRRCTDATPDVFTSLDAQGTRELVLRVGGQAAPFAGDVFGTRCMGPAAAELAQALPAVRVPVAVLRRGRTTIDLGGERPFAGGGLAGTVRSTVTATFGRATTRRHARRTVRRPAPSRPVRFATAEYSVRTVSGSLRAEVAPPPDPFPCTPLDVCGLSGSITVQPAVDEGSFHLFARSRRLSRGQLRAVLRGRRRGADVQGFGFFNGRGTVSADLGRPDGPPCRSTAAMPGGALDGHLRGERLRVGLLSLQRSLLQTRCPSPMFASDRPLAVGSVPRSALRGRTLKLRLREGRSEVGEGFAVNTRPDLTIVLERIRTKIESEPYDGP